MECELCGSNNAKRKTEIDGAILNVCAECVKFGKPIAEVEIRKEVKDVRMPKEMNQTLKDGFQDIIRKEREKMKLTQDQLASKIGEKHNIVKRIEEGWMPPFSIAMKLEKLFRISLIEEMPEVEVKSTKNGKGLSLGDFIKK